MGIVLNFLFIRLCGFVQFPGDIQIVVRRYSYLLALTGTAAQLKCLGVVFTGSPRLGQTEVSPPSGQVAHRKIGVELDGALVVRHSRARSFFPIGFLPQRVGF